MLWDVTKQLQLCMGGHGLGTTVDGGGADSAAAAPPNGGLGAGAVVLQQARDANDFASLSASLPPRPHRQFRERDLEEEREMTEEEEEEGEEEEVVEEEVEEEGEEEEEEASSASSAAELLPEPSAPGGGPPAMCSMATRSLQPRARWALPPRSKSPKPLGRDEGLRHAAVRSPTAPYLATTPDTTCFLLRLLVT